MTEKYKKDTLQEYQELKDWWGDYLKELHKKSEEWKKKNEEKDGNKRNH